ncbi:MAG: hypothetical protein NC223_02345, partial [Butyrivibrio sp.]|nr:hypothetical protein [Butyrivibrio sp.]
MGKSDKRRGVYGVFEAAAVSAAVLVLLVLTVMSLEGRAYMPMDWHERVVFRGNGIFFWLALTAVAVLLFALFRVISKIPPKTLFIACSALFAAAGFFLIINAPSALRADAGSVYYAAWQFNGGDYRSLSFGEYMYMYPHQLGLATFWRPLVLSGFGAYAAFAANLAMAMTANFSLWGCARLVYGENSPTVNYVCIMLFLFLPHLFFVLFAYGTTCGLCFLCLSLYFGVKYLKGRGGLCAVFCVLFSALSCVVRNNNYIGAIAIGIGFVFYAVKDKKPFRLLVPAAMLALTACMLFLIKWGYGAAANAPVGGGMPKTLWIAM